MLSHRALLSNAATLAALWRFTSSDVLIHALPLFHVHGLFVATHTSLMAGASMRLQMRFDSATVLAAMGESSVLMGVPTYYVRLLAESGLTAARAAGMRLFISGSAPLLAQTFEDWRARTGKPILERYGMTETGMNASNPCDGERRGGTVGPPLPGVEIRIVDAADAPLPQRATGQVQVRGPNLFSGYWRAPEKTRRAFAADGWFRTGDLGAFDSDGYLCLSGRASDLIISGGLNVYPAEVERQIDQVAGVRESAVIGLPHPDLGEAVTAIIAGDALSEAEVLASLVGTLARFKQPKRALFVEALPRNSMGKVVKAELRERYAELYLST
jgi:malonyl-CoA/methylmalonyl-CoA synthetase